MKKRLIRNSEKPERPKIQQQSTLQVESSEEESDHDQNKKDGRFQIIDEQEEKQGKLDNYFRLGKTEIINNKTKKQKVFEFKMQEQDTNNNEEEESKQPSMNQDDDSDDDLPNLNHLFNITRSSTVTTIKTNNSQQQQQSQVLEKNSFNKQEPEIDKNYISIQDQNKIEVEEEYSHEIVSQKPLTKNQYFFLGEFGNITKQQLQQIILHYGGQLKSRVQKGVILVTGDKLIVDKVEKDIEKNHNYKSALDYKSPIFKIQDFSNHLKSLTGNDLMKSLEATEKQSQNTIVEEKQDSQQMSIKLEQQVQQTSTIKPIIKETKPNLLAKFEKEVVIIDQPVQIQPQIASLSKNKSKPEEDKQLKQTIDVESNKNKHQLWTTKYAPRVVTDCLDQSHVVTVVKWLDNWGKSSLEIQPGSFQAYNLSAKALLLSGPPGIGKTTIIRLISKQKNYSLIEWNASDVRSKLQIENYVKHLQDNTVLKFKDSNLITEAKTIILMDEVDGMTGSDKGGNKCLIDMIKLTKVPIVCICNDRSKTAMRTLANHCLDLQFKKPNSDEIFKKLENICRLEQISYDPKELKQQIDVSQCDVRQLLNMLQMHKVGLKLHIDKNIGKDSTVTTNVFEAAKMLLSFKDAEKLSLHKLMDYYFQDPDITQLLYQENYLDVKRSPANSIGNISLAAQSLAEADVINTKVRSQLWGLMPNAGFLSTMYPTQLLKSNLLGKVQFPQFFGKLSSENKMKRQIQEVKEQFAEQTILTNSKAIQFQYIEPFAFMIIKSLADNGTSSVDEIVTLLRNYKLTIPQFEECIVGSLALFPKRDVFADIPTAVKSVLNKTFKEHMDSADKILKEKRAAQGQVQKKQRMDDLNEEGLQDEEDEEEEKPQKKKAKIQKENQTKQQQPKGKKYQNQNTFNKKKGRK